MKPKSAILSLAVSLACLSACALSEPVPSAAQSPESLASNPPRLFEEENVLILLDSEQEANELAINVSRRGYQLIEKRRLNGLGLILLDFQRPAGVTDEIAINDMRAMSPSATVGLDNLYQTQAPYKMPNAAAAQVYANDLLGWPSEGCQAQTAIGIIDGHLSNSVNGLPASNIVRRNFMRGEASASQHADAVTKLILGPGRLRQATVYSAGVIGTTRSGFTGSGAKEIVLALDWMRTERVPVVNISLAGPHNPLLERAVSQVAEDGMVLVAAVGNEGPDAPPQYPAAFEPVIAVTAIDVEREIYRNAVRGPHVEYAAPGVDIFIESGSERGRFVSGTSFAAPFITALIAADPSHSFTSSASGVRTFLNQRTLDLGESGPDPVFGRGMVRVNNACAS